MVIDSVSHLQAASARADGCNPAMEFIPGSHWTTLRARAAVASALYTYHDKGGRLALEKAFLGARPSHPSNSSPTEPLSDSPIIIRRATRCDTQAISDVIRGAGLFPFLVGEFVEGFAVAEQDGRLVGCAGLEPYETAGMIRSVAVLPSAAGRGLGRLLVEALIADARASGLLDLYLFTPDARSFWAHLGFADVPYGRWDPSTRSAWQVNFVMDHPDFVERSGLHSMWLPLVGAPDASSANFAP